MIGSNQYELNWEHFNQLHPDKKTAFENLCRSLFAKEFCADSSILHSNPNHPGVEVSPVLARDNKTLISFQAKHFDGSVRYDQIKSSINNTVSKYVGHLDCVYLFCNKDINSECSSFMEIEELLASVNMKIILVTGQTILDMAMNYSTILSCYFGLDCIDDDWFQKNLNNSLDNLGQRYNSLFNIDTEAQKMLSLFLNDENGIDVVNSKKTELIEYLDIYRYGCDGKYNREIRMLQNSINNLPDVDWQSIEIAFNWCNEIKNTCCEILSKLDSKLSNIKTTLSENSLDAKKYRALRHEEQFISDVLSAINELAFSEYEMNLINSKVVFVTGKMGTGKTQLLSNCAKQMIDVKRPALLILGQSFISTETIETQIIQNLQGFDLRHSFDSLLAALEEKSEQANADAIIFIDAINESINRNIWATGLNRILSNIMEYSHIKIVISIRSGFESITISSNLVEKMNNEIPVINHEGLVDSSPSRIYEFLSNYGIPYSPEYYLNQEMTNPLFLSWFCQNYNGHEQELFSLIETVINRADTEGSINAGGQEPFGILWDLLYEIIDVSENGMTSKQELLQLNTWNIFGVNDKIAYLNAVERTGVLVSYVKGKTIHYYIGYNLLGDYIRAYRIVEREVTKEKIQAYCRDVLLGIDLDGNVANWENSSVFAMVASLFAIKTDEELIELIGLVNDDWGKQQLLEDYFTAYIWRSSHVKLDCFMKLIKEYPINKDTVWNIFIENSIKEKSELNAIGLSKVLNGYSLNRRDLLWTTTINQYDEYNRIISLAYYLEEGNSLLNVSSDKVFLLLVVYSWMLSSSNRTLRDRVSKAMIELLKDNFSICEKLLIQFKDVDDPYILQRLYGVVFGALMRRTPEKIEDISSLVYWIYNEIFNKEYVYPDILLRDYARLIIERFIAENPDDVVIDRNRIKPPYKSKSIPEVEEVDYSSDEYGESGLWPLLHSMKFDTDVKGVGMYGDFGRYVYQYALNNFIGVDVKNIYYYSISYILDELGYRFVELSKYDRQINYVDRHETKRIERIGKKYQWITMYNVLARLSDSYKVKSGTWNDTEGLDYEGAWNPYVRDFDPTLNIKVKGSREMIDLSLPLYGKESFIDIDSTKKQVSDWVIANDKMFSDFPTRLICKDSEGHDWVSLYSYQENRLHPVSDDFVIPSYPKGEQHIWSALLAYFIPKIKGSLKVSDLKKMNIIRRKSKTIDDYYELFSREYAWSPGYNSLELSTEEYEDDVTIYPAAINFLWEEACDASQETSTSFIIPSGIIIQSLNLYERDVDGVYFRNGDIVALDVARLGYDHSEMLIRKDALDDFLTSKNMQLFWTVIGEKQFFYGDINHSQDWQRREGYFLYSNNEILGDIEIVDNY